MRTVLTLVVALAMVVSMGLIPAFTQGYGKESKKDMAPEQVMEEFMKLHTPGKEHQTVQSWAGEYMIEGKMWMPGSKDAMDVKGWSVVKKVGQAFAQEKMTLVCGGKKMWGEGFFGYCNECKMYQTTWIGGWSTTQRQMLGSWNDKLGGLEWKGEYKCPITGKAITERIVNKAEKDGRMSMMMYLKMEGMDEMKKAELWYTLVQ